MSAGASDERVRKIAQAVLYEGYLLWPYRRSAMKNQQRFTFGGIHPPGFEQVAGDRSGFVMECLVEGGAEARVELVLRFLHLAQVPGWEEAIEREVQLGPLALPDLTGGTVREVSVAPGSDTEERAGEVVERRWDGLEGRLEISAEALGDALHRLSLRFANTSGWSGDARAQALRHTFLSAHVVARAHGGAFVSLTDPPAALAEQAQGCRNDGVWPVLAGEEGERDLLFGSPIILSDHPMVAPESPGDLFDGGEIDALLIHSIRSLSDAEREEMAATDPRAREILERSMGLTPDQMLGLYGAVREMRPLEH